MFRIKFCGVTNHPDALAVAEAGADAIGLNFYPGSKRCIPHLEANFICCDLPKTVKRVGVFVNASREEVLETANQLQLDWVQLHGDETIEYVRGLKSLRVLRAVRWSPERSAEVGQQLEQLRLECPNVKAILLDAFSPTDFGGTGHVIPWEQVAALSLEQYGIPWVLAGGLRPENVANAVHTTQPYAVDVASGIELEPGRKDRQKMQAFANQADEAFRKLPGR
jgi:phosphoribosylanthranilate isomerase